MLGYNSLVYIAPELKGVLVPDLIVSNIAPSGEMSHHRHEDMKWPYLLELNNCIYIPLEQAMRNVDTPNLSEKEKKKLGQLAFTFTIIDDEGDLKTEYALDYENPNYNKPFTILWKEKGIVFEEEGFVDILMKTHFGKGKYGWVKMRIS